jgi:hypothetical protein
MSSAGVSMALSGMPTTAGTLTSDIIQDLS